MLNLDRIKKVFRTSEVETTALDNVTLSVTQGEFAAVMGPSGCGKSTLLNILGMLDTPTEGAYWFRGEDVSKCGERKLALIRRQNVGFIFQSFNLIDELTVFGNVELPLLYQKVRPADRRERVEAVLGKVGILARRDHLPQQLSGGQQQRVAVARAIVVEPNVILADEPTGNLDSSSGEDVMNLLVRLNTEGTTIVMVTHSEPNAQYAQRTIRMLDGRVLTGATRARAPLTAVAN